MSRSYLKSTGQRPDASRRGLIQDLLQRLTDTAGGRFYPKIGCQRGSNIIRGDRSMNPLAGQAHAGKHDRHMGVIAPGRSVRRTHGQAIKIVDKNIRLEYHVETFFLERRNGRQPRALRRAWCSVKLGIGGSGGTFTLACACRTGEPHVHASVDMAPADSILTRTDHMSTQAWT